MRNVTSTTLSQQILDGKLLPSVTDKQKRNFSRRVRLKTHYNQPLRICYENIAIIALLQYYWTP